MSALRDDYSANALNQYVSRENNTVSISGTAASDSVVAVKGRNVTAGRQGRFWSDEVTVSNVLGPWTGPLSVYANRTVGGSSVMRIDSRSAAIPAVAQTLTYDLDGNTLSDGLWDYQWDAENRLVRLETAVAARSAGIAHRIINFTYDYLGRRVQKQVIDGVTVTELSSARFIYNDWNVIGEYTAPGGAVLAKLQRTYAWGLDVASSVSNSGGVGALLQFDAISTDTVYIPSYDGNGNVTSLLNIKTAALAAVFEYSPYGELLRDEILDNSLGLYCFRFSTKWLDIESGYIYFGARYYSPMAGRFFGRDPLAEAGGVNLYNYTGNSPSTSIDVNGQYPWRIDGRMYDVVPVPNPIFNSARLPAGTLSTTVPGRWGISIGIGFSVFGPSFQGVGFSGFGGKTLVAFPMPSTTPPRFGTPSLQPIVGPVPVKNPTPAPRIPVTPTTIAAVVANGFIDALAGLSLIGTQQIQPQSDLPVLVGAGKEIVSISIAEWAGLDYNNPRYRLASTVAGIFEGMWVLEGARIFSGPQVQSINSIAAATERLISIANDSIQELGPGSGPVYGTTVHTIFSRRIASDDIGSSVIVPKRAYLDGIPVNRGTPGSSLPDAILGPIDAPIAVFDFKTGGAIMDAEQLRNYRKNLPNGDSIPIIVIRPFP